MNERERAEVRFLSNLFGDLPLSSRGVPLPTKYRFTNAAMQAVYDNILALDEMGAAPLYEVATEGVTLPFNPIDYRMGSTMDKGLNTESLRALAFGLQKFVLEDGIAQVGESLKGWQISRAGSARQLALESAAALQNLLSLNAITPLDTISDRIDMLRAEQHLRQQRFLSGEFTGASIPLWLGPTVTHCYDYQKHELPGEFRPGYLYALEGPQGGGKSTIAAMMAEHTAMIGNTALFIHIENLPSQEIERAVMRNIGGTITEFQRGLGGKYIDAFEALAETWPGQIIYAHGSEANINDIADIVARVRPSIVFVDYLQKIVPSPEQARATELELFTKNLAKLKNIAESPHWPCPVVILSQLNKEGTSYGVGSMLFQKCQGILLFKRDGDNPPYASDRCCVTWRKLNDVPISDLPPTGSFLMSFVPGRNMIAATETFGDEGMSFWTNVAENNPLISKYVPTILQVSSLDDIQNSPFIRVSKKKTAKPIVNAWQRG